MTIENELRPSAAVDAMLRRQAVSKGCMLNRSRRAVSIDQMGGYMLVDLFGNFVIDGERFELGASDVLRAVDALP